MRRRRICWLRVENILAHALGHDASQLAATEKRDLLARLLGRLAHEIRNPLSSLDVHFQLLEEDLAQLPAECSEKTASRFEIIHGELHRLKSIVSQFLRLAGPSALELEEVRAETVVKHVCDLLRPEAAQRQIEITMQLGPGLPALQADSVKLTQALLNLVINAMQAVEREGVVNATAGVSGEFVAFEVSDDGPGIAPEQLPEIFDPYFTTKNEGHGLGLWIAQQIATAHNGRLSARNLPGKGAAFTMLIPVFSSPSGACCG